MNNRDNSEKSIIKIDGLVKRYGRIKALDGKTNPQQVLVHLISRGMAINRFEVATPSLNEIFLKEVGKNNE